MNAKYAEIAELAFFVGAIANSPHRIQKFITQFNSIPMNVPGATEGNQNRYIQVLIAKIQESKIMDSKSPDIRRFITDLLKENDPLLQTSGELLQRSLLKN